LFFKWNSSGYGHNSAWREADNGFCTYIHKRLKLTVSQISTNYTEARRNDIRI